MTAAPRSPRSRSSEADSSRPARKWLGELRRRRVHRVALAYGAGAFAVLQGADLLVDGLGMSPALFQWTLVLVVVGLPLALVLGWVYDFEEGRLRRTGPETPGGTGRPTVRYVAGVLGALTAGVLFWLFGPLPTQGSVVAGADVMAVLPFGTSGPGTEGLDEGMVDLLSTNLDEVGDIRTVDPARTLAVARDRREGGRLSREEAVEVGREIQAGSVLQGILSVAGGAARLRAELFSTMDGSVLAEAEVEGPETEIFRLVDSLSVQVLRDVWRSDGPLPNLDLSAVTTADPQALRYYLTGEAYRRRAQWDSAEAALRRAVEADSTFALATENLASVLGWSDRGAPEIPRLRELALRHRDRLPSDARRAALADDLWQRGRFREARDTLADLLAQDPDDPRAWFLLGEVRYHGRAQGAFPNLPSDSIHAAFRRALAGVPQDASALLHPIGLSFADHRPDLFQDYLNQFRDNAGPEKAAAVADAGGFLFGGGPSFPAVLSGLAREAPVLIPEFFSGLIWNTDRDLATLGDSALASLSRRSLQVGARELNDAAALLNATGRWQEARPLLMELLEIEPGLAGRNWATAVSLAMAPVSSIPQGILEAMSMEAGYPLALHLRAMEGLWRGDGGAAEPFLEWVTDLDSIPPTLEGVAPGIRGWGGILRGDTAPALPILEKAVEVQFLRGNTGEEMPGDFFLLPFLRIEAAQPASAQEVLNRLDTHPWISPVFFAPVTLVRGEALLTLGREEEARRHLERVTRVLRRAGEGVYPLGRARDLLDSLAENR